jgi:peptidoglycan/LPS O-acetylase OafA/YrhL
MPGRRLGHRPALDGVRALAIVGVMGLHALDRVFRGGFFGVDIFFVLSAFLITTLIVEEINARDRFSFASFYARRALRLGPALLLWLAVVAAPTAIVLHQGSTIPLATLVSLFYVGDFAVAAGAHIGDAYTHIWSLAIEEQFYAIWPGLLVFVVAKRPRISGRTIAILSAVVIAVSLSSAHFFASNYFLPTGHLIPLFAGCLAAYAFARDKHQIRRLLQRQSVGLLCVVALVLAIVGYRTVGADAGTLIQAAVAVATAILILHLCWRERGVIRALFSSPPALWLGRRSYGLYLYHRTLSALVPALIPGITLRFAGPLVLVLAFVVAEASFRFVERPVSRAGRSRLRSHHYPAVREAESDLPLIAS